MNNDAKNSDEARSEDKLMADASRLARDVPPARDLWPEIEAAIQVPQQEQSGFGRRFMPYLAQAAAIVLLVGASSTATYYLVGADKNSATPTLGNSYTLSQASWGGNEMGADFQMARQDVRTQLQVELDKLPPESRAEVEHNLSVIRTAINEINAELEKQPGNIHLQELLMNSYQDELAVMQKVGGLTQSVMSRNDI